MGGRRSNGEGTAYRYRDHKGRPRYRAQWTVPNPRDPDGPPQRRSKAGFETKRDALAFAADQLAAARQGTPAPGPAGGVTLAEHANAWLDGHRAAATTLADYRRKYRLHIDPVLGRVELGRVRQPTRVTRVVQGGAPGLGKRS